MLTDTAIKALKSQKKLYKVSDRDGMYVVVQPSGAIVFRYDYRLNGRRETLTLGRYGPDGLSLARAREKLIDAKRAISEGRSPAQEKQHDKRRLKEAKRFGEFGEKWFQESRMGTERVLNMATIKRHYDALGSYLHVPTIKQRKAGAKIDAAKFRVRCEEIAAYLTEVLASPVWNSTMGNFASLDCMKCGHPIRKRMPHGQDVVDAKCFECGVTYKITDAGEGKALFEPDQVEVKCANQECKTSIFPWRSEIENGRSWKCEVCGGENDIKLMIQHRPATAIEPAKAEGDDA